ncbi:MAG: hypothetical protein WCO63_06605 [Bacteroidota bacterium]
MEPIKTDWTKEEFNAYVLLYAAEANFFETTHEEAIIRDRINEDTFRKILHEIKHDNEFERLSKIMYCAEKFKYSHEDVDTLMEAIKELFLADERFDAVEQSIFVALKRILTRS